MRLLTQVIWWAGNGLLLLLLCRAVICRLLPQYPGFYAYVAYVFTTSLLLFYLSIRHPVAYARFYWFLEAPALLLGFGVTWEIYRKVLEHYPGVRRVARTLLVSALLYVIFVPLVGLLSGPEQSMEGNWLLLERNLRVIQTVLLTILFILVVWYAMPLHRNLLGISLGYGFFIATSVLNLSFRSHLGVDFQPWWVILQPVEYCVTLAVWCLGLWSKVPEAPPPDDMERDYEVLEQRAVKALNQLRAHIGQVVAS